MHTPQEPAHTLVLNAAEGIIQFLLARHETTTLSTQPQLTPLCFQGWHAPGQGAELLCPALENTLALLRVPVASVQRIACVQGPGSFTGIRLALGTAAGLARATGAAQAGLDYTVLLAQAALRRLATSSAQPTSLLVATHARRGLVHARLFSVANNTALPCGPVLALPLEAAADAAINALPSPAATTTTLGAPLQEGHLVLLGSGLTRNKLFWEEVSAAHPGVCLLPPCFDHPEEADLLHAALGANYGQQDIEPVYVRPSDAEENLEGIAHKLGLNPAQARTSLEQLTTESKIVSKEPLINSH